MTVPFRPAHGGAGPGLLLDLAISVPCAGSAGEIDAASRPRSGDKETSVHHISGFEGEVRQGKQVAEVAKRVGVAQLVYTALVQASKAATLAIHPGALTVRQWLERKLAPAGPRRQGRTSA